MPNDDDRDATIHNEPATPVAATGATPNFGLGEVKEAFRGLAKEILDEAAQRYQAANRPAPLRPSAPPAPTEEEYNSLDDNQRRLVDKAINNGLFQVRQELGQLRDLGLSRIADLTTRQAAETLPYYKEYQAEIDREVAALDINLRTDPNTISFVHDRVAMRHEPERIRKIQDEAIRSARGDAPAPSRTTSRGSVREAIKSGEVATPEELGLNDDQISEIDHMGGPDAFARRISDGRIADWKTYAERHARFKASRGIKGSVIVFPKLDSKKLPKVV